MFLRGGGMRPYATLCLGCVFFLLQFKMIARAGKFKVENDSSKERLVLPEQDSREKMKIGAGPVISRTGEFLL